MNEKRERVVIFEDNDESLRELTREIDHRLATVGAVAVWHKSAKEARAISAANLQKIVMDLLLQPHAATLVLLDWDLTMYVEPITRELVRGQCDENGLPLVVYHAAKGVREEAKRLLRWNESQISLDSYLPYDEIARRAVSFYLGFQKIKAAIETGHDRDFGHVLRDVLQPPASAESHVDRYARGKTKTLEVADAEAAMRNQVAATNTGYWIYNRLLQFPGVLLNPTAAASFLDIDPEDFSRPEIRRLFEPALYKGPFHETGPYWWATELDEVCAQRAKQDAPRIPAGREIAANETGANVRRAVCVHNGHEGAGFYCILRRQAVCEEHSVAPSWLPAGAERSRIESDRYKQLAPWLGL